MNDVRNLLGRLQVQDFDYREFEPARAPRRSESAVVWAAPPQAAPEGVLQAVQDPRKSSMADIFAVVAGRPAPQARPAS